MNEPVKYCFACGAPVDLRAELCPHCGVRQSDRGGPDLRKAASDKLAAGLCGIFLGYLGIHKFLLGLNTQGVILLAVTLLTCGIGAAVSGTIGLIEGIIYLTRTDEDFLETYIVGKKSWF